MVNDIPLSQVRHFLLVAEHASFQAAAARAFRSQPAITKSIAAMEQRLGAKLFEPGNRTALTPFGHACRPYAMALVQHHERALLTMTAMARKEMGVLEIAAIAGIASNWMPQLMQAYAADFPGVSIRLQDDNSEKVEKLVLSGEIDFGIASPVSMNEKLDFRPLLVDEFGLICSRSHALSRRRSLKWRQLGGLALIGTTVHLQLAGTPEATYLERPVIRIATVLTMFSMLLGDARLALVGARTGVPSFMKDSLAFVPLLAERRTRTIGIVRIKGQSLSPAAQEMERRLIAYSSHVSLRA